MEARCVFLLLVATAIDSHVVSNVDKFVKFINLMINDVTYLMDESLSELTQIYNIQTEMENKEEWASKPAQYRRERESTLRQLERHASGYITLGKSTVGLLKDFTAETKTPFMMPEIIDRLAAMLDYNLDALVGPKCQELKVKDAEKYRFKPRELLSDILQVFLNLSDQPDFVQAVAGEGRSYRKELFERAAGIAIRKALKTETEIEQLRLFVIKVEEAKANLEAEEDLGEIPDEFLGKYCILRLHKLYLLHWVGCRSSHVYSDARPSHVALVENNHRPFYHQVPLVI
jgi:ubiquitin conjugation factor E4 B